MNPTTKFSFLSLLIILPHVTIAHQNADQLSMIKKVCAGTGNKDLCINVLAANPWEHTVNNIFEAVAVAIRVAGTAATDVTEGIKKSAASPSSSKSMQIDKHCLKQYQGAVDELKTSLYALARNSFEEVSTKVEAAVVAVNSCEEELKKNPNDKELMHLSMNNGAISNLLYIVLGLKQQLLGQN